MTRPAWIIGALLISLAAHGKVDAQVDTMPGTTSSVRVGSVLRVVTSAGDTTIGWYRGMHSDTILLRDRNHQLAIILTPSVVSLDLGRTRVGDRVAKGVGVGVAVGMVVGVLAFYEPNCSDSCFSPGVSAVIGAVPFGILGGLLGAVVGTTTIAEWRRLYPVNGSR